jgi:hypothetical protein
MHWIHQAEERVGLFQDMKLTITIPAVEESEQETKYGGTWVHNPVTYQMLIKRSVTIRFPVALSKTVKREVL